MKVSVYGSSLTTGFLLSVKSIKPQCTVLDCREVKGRGESDFVVLYNVTQENSHPNRIRSPVKQVTTQ